jgi:hypothetical protein
MNFCLTGKSLKTCPVSSRKIFRFRRRANQRYQLAPSRPARGALRGRHERWTGTRWTRQRARRARQCVRRSRVVLTPRRWCQVLGKLSLLGSDGGKKAGHRGDHVISRKTIAQGRPDCSAEPVCSCAFLLVHLAHETAGAARTRSSLRPLFYGGGSFAKLGRIAPRGRETIFNVVGR